MMSTVIIYSESIYCVLNYFVPGTVCIGAHQRRRQASSSLEELIVLWGEDTLSTVRKSYEHAYHFPKSWEKIV
jgi:hypothetical protein